VTSGGSAAATQRAQVMRGIGCMLAAVGFFAGMDTFLKLFSQYYPAVQVSAMRGAASLPFVLLSVLVRGHLRDLKPVNWKLHLWRGVLAITMLSAFVYSVRTLPLADAYAVFLVAPLLVTGFAAPLLGERVDARRWAAISIGLVGVIVLLRPTGQGLSTLGALAAFLAALCYALAAVSVRVLTRTDTTSSMVFWFTFMMMVSGGLLALPGWVEFKSEHWPWLVAVGILGALGQHFITEAFRHAPASRIAPFEYTALLWAVSIDWLVWRHAPNTAMLVGGAVIIGSGLYLIHLERRPGGGVGHTAEAEAQHP
jgi:drug/metabolite transporter (DMT)-like permease